MNLILENDESKKKSDKKQLDEHIEKIRQSKFAKEQARESVFTRQIESIVDVDSV